MARLFGTDGVRGVANTQLTCDLAFKLGQAAVAFQGKTILIGKDTRLSGDMLESAVAAGIMSMGGTALLAGIIPTPAIALLVRELLPDCPEAAAALGVLGYSGQEVQIALKGVDVENLPLEEIIRQSLKKMVK